METEISPIKKSDYFNKTNVKLMVVIAFIFLAFGFLFLISSFGNTYLLAIGLILISILFVLLAILFKIKPLYKS